MIRVAKLLAAGAALACLGAPPAAIADAFPVFLPTRIFWAPDFPFIPSTASATSMFFTDARGEIGFTSFAGEDPSAGITDVPFPPQGFFPIFPGETIQWSFGGFLNFDSALHPLCAYADTQTPAEPCDPDNAPRITIATLANADFGSFSVTGQVFAFFSGEPVLIGTWEIRSDQGMIPEPATCALLGVGLLALLARLPREANPFWRSARPLIQTFVAVEPGRLNQTHHRGGTLACAQRSRKQPVRAPQCDQADPIFGTPLLSMGSAPSSRNRVSASQRPRL